MSNALKRFRQKLEKEATDLKISFGSITTNSELQSMIERKRAEKSPGARHAPPTGAEAKPADTKVEIIRPEPPLSAPATVYAGQPVQMAFNIAPPQLQYQFQQAPAWWEIAARLKDGVLFMIAGAALWQLVLQKVVM